MDEFNNNNKLLKIKLENKEYELNDKMVQFELKDVVIHEEKFIPHVIEPSFGMGRLL